MVTKENKKKKKVFTNITNGCTIESQKGGNTN